MIICTRRFSNETIPLRHPRIVHSLNASVWIIGRCINIGYPPPPLDIDLNSRTLDLRETASRLVVETIEDALRAGGLALFDERFQIDSSLDWVLGEAVGGELDAVVPLWSKDGHVVFAQPGFVLWNGLADEERLDGNLGVVYRTETIKGIIGGVSLFYDHDFQIGHSRIGIGVDAQRDGFYSAFNYYHPLSDTQDGREGYVEDALQGMDASLAVESNVTRVGGNVGYWLFRGDEDLKDEWEFSYGFDAGLRLMPGVFLEGRLERHDKKASFGRRASVGLAFRFTLPDLDGKSYGDVGTVSNLYRPVDREKRILYEEREADGILLTLGEGVIEEGEEINAAIRLREASTEDVVINLVGSGTATYGEIGDDGDWLLNNGSGNCSAVTGTSCQITITAGQTEPANDVVITINPDGGGEGPETIVLSTTIASGDASLTSRPLIITIPVDPPLPTVSLSADTTSIAEGGTATLTLTLSRTLGSDATFNLIAGGTEATYGASNDWNLDVGGTDCDMASESNPCQVTVSQGDTTAEVTVEVNTDSTAESPENFTVSVVVDSGSITIVQPGSSSSLPFTIPANNIIKFASSTLSIMEPDIGFIIIELSSNLPAGVEITLAISGDAEDGDYGVAASNRQISDGADYEQASRVYTFPTNTMEAILVFEATSERASPDTDNEEVIIQLTDPNNNLPDGWSIVEPSTITVTITDAG